MRLKTVIACGAFAPLLIAATQPVRLQPSSPWDVDYAENSCRLIRTFGEGKNQVKLAFESAAPGEMDMLVVGKPLGTFSEQVRARFLPVGGKTFDGRVAQTVTKGEPALLLSNMQMLPDDMADPILKAREARQKTPTVRPPSEDLKQRAVYEKAREQFTRAATELEIETRPRHPVVLETGSLGEPMKAFDQCGRDSLKDWGVDPDLEDKIVRPAWAPMPPYWLYPNDYPADMVDKGKESEVSVRLLIDATGKITKCTSLSHFAEQEFNQITCARILERAHFEPAELADGTKVPSYSVKRIVFRMAR